MDLRVLRTLAVVEPSNVRLRVVNVTAPAAGADWSATVPGESVWQLLATRATLVTSSHVSNRTPALNVSDGSTTYATVNASANVTASLTTVLCWLADSGHNDISIIGGNLTMAVPAFTLPGGHVVSVTTGLIDTADQWSGVSLLVLEQFAGRVEHERSIVQRIVDKAEAIADILEGDM